MPHPDLPQPFRWTDGHITADLGSAGALFTTRHGGVSAEPYRSLNLGFLTDDDRAHVLRNREIAGALTPGRLANVRQVHGTTVLTLDAPTAQPIDPSALPEADGVATATPGVVPMVLAADCLPVVIAGPGAVAAVHAGWNGLASGVLQAGVHAVRSLSEDGALCAAIGPGAGPCCYEVGDEVRAHFDPATHRGRHLDLKLAARQALEQAGVGMIHDTGLCTICSDPELFFSHRRDGGITGRQGGFGWLR